MKQLLTVLSFLSIGLFSVAQTATIIDADTQLPIHGATVMSRQLKAFDITNARGQVDLQPFRGAEKIEIQHLGYAVIVTSYQKLEDTNFLVELQVSNLEIEEVVISATRWNQTTWEVPSQISNISAKDIEFQAPQTSADLLGISGKVFIQKSQQGGGSPMIRGFATNRLIYTVDGVRMNTAIFRGGNIQNVINLDPFATEKTEVLFGPGSVIYGSDAIGGVMSFQTLTPRLSISDKALVSGKAITRFGSANHERTAHFDVNVGWQKWAMVTSFSAWDFDHLRQGRYGPEDFIKDYHVQRYDQLDVIIPQDDPLLQIPSAYSQMNLMQKLRFKPTSNWDIQYGFHYSETSPFGRYDRHNRLRNGIPRYAEWNYGPQTWMMNNLSVSHQRDAFMYHQLTVRLAQQQFAESRIDRSFNGLERTTNSEEVDAYSINVDFVKETGEKNTLFYGVESVINGVSSTGTITHVFTGESSRSPSRYPQSTWRSSAIYVNDEYRLSDKFIFQGGIRLNTFSLDADFSQNLEFYPFDFDKTSIENNALTGSLGLVYRANRTWVIKMNVGSAFRAPNIDDMGKVFDSEPGAVTIPNPDLEAEYAYNADLGLAKVFGDRMKLEISGYYTRLENALVRRNFQLDGADSIMYAGEMSQVQAIQNASHAQVYGLQLGFELKLIHGFTFSTDLNYQQGEEELGDGTMSATRHAAPLFGTSRLSYRQGALRLQLYGMYQAERSHEDLPLEERAKDEIYALDHNGNTFAPAWYTLNFKAMYDITEHFALSSGVENITDQRYRPYSSGISGAGRNIYLSLRANF